MKMFLKILLAVNFLLQISMAYDEEYFDIGYDDQYDGDELEKDSEKPSLEEHKHEEHKHEPAGSYPDNAIYAEDIVPCESLSTDIKAVQDNIESCHNNHRSNVVPEAANMLKISWNEKLAKSAQKWANTCNLNHSQVKDRNDNGIAYGENILVSPACITWEKAIIQWWNEGRYLVYGVGPIKEYEIGHYTQMATDHTYQVGCGYKECNVDGKIKIFFVCQYNPAGNQLSSRYKPYEQGKWCSRCKKACDEGGKLCLNFCPHSNEARNCPFIAEVGLCHAFQEMCKAACLCKNEIFL